MARTQARLDAGLAAAQEFPPEEALRNIRARMQSLFGDIPLALVDATVLTAYARYEAGEPGKVPPAVSDAAKSRPRAAMHDREVQKIATEAVTLRRSHAHAPALDVLDIIMTDRHHTGSTTSIDPGHPPHSWGSLGGDIKSKIVPTCGSVP